MKRVCDFTKALMMCCILLLVSCGQKTSTWQGKYDLGIRYLSEGNYEEAIIAFTAAIEIDPKQALAYVGRGDAYIASEEKNLPAAQADYEKAIELDNASINAYISLADIYIQQEQYEKALEILRQGYEITNDEDLLEKRNSAEALYIPKEANLTERLDMSDIRYTYEEDRDAGQQNEGAIGWMRLQATVNGPSNVCNVHIWSWQKEPYMEDQINREATTAVSIWRQEGANEGGSALPFNFDQRHPVYPDDQGTVKHVLVIGTDDDGDAVAYGIIGEEIP